MNLVKLRHLTVDDVAIAHASLIPHVMVCYQMRTNDVLAAVLDDGFFVYTPDQDGLVAFDGMALIAENRLRMISIGLLPAVSMKEFGVWPR